MDSDFQAHYLTAEQAYGAGDFRTAQSITVDLLGQLNGMAETNADRDALLAWRAFVALLAGNIHLYGLNEPDQARGFFVRFRRSLARSFARSESIFDARR